MVIQKKINMTEFNSTEFSSFQIKIYLLLSFFDKIDIPKYIKKKIK